MSTLNANEVAALAGVTEQDIRMMLLAHGFRNHPDDQRPDIPFPENEEERRAAPDRVAPLWDRSKAEHWAAEWRRIGAEAQAAIDAAEKAARDAHAARNDTLASLVPTEVYAVPAFSAATLPGKAADRPDWYLYVGQEPLRYDHGRLLGPSYYVEGVRDGEVVFRERLLLCGTNVVPERIDVTNTLATCATRLGTPAIRRLADLYDQADPALWRETASDVQALIAERLTRLFGTIGRRSTAAHLRLDQRAKDGGLNNVDKKLARARELDESEDLGRLARARMLATVLGIDLDADLRQ